MTILNEHTKLSTILGEHSTMVPIDPGRVLQLDVRPIIGAGKAWQNALDRFAGGQFGIDVRDMPMPQPMMTILDNLDRLSATEALFVRILGT